jgi:hypothetical protein
MTSSKQQLITPSCKFRTQRSKINLEEKVMKKTKKNVLLAASVTGLLAVAAIAAGANKLYSGEEVFCSGINACKGQGVCGGKNHSCAGQNACKGEGWVKADSADACAAQGGTVVKGM